MMGKTKPSPAIVLLAEDDPGDQELTRRAFEEGKLNTDLRIVENSEEAVDYLKRRGRFADPESSPRPDLILLDINMPKLDGWGVLQLIDKDPELRGISVAVLTVSKAEEDMVRSYHLGGISFISKPLDILVVESLLRKTP